VDGADIYFEEAGNAHGAPLLLLHGGLGTIEDFNPLLRFGLAEEYRLIGVDSRGHGRSTLGSTQLTYERLELDVIAVLRHLGIGTTAILGFSDGGVIGYRLMVSGVVDVPRMATIGAGHELRDDDPVRPILMNVTAERWLGRFPGTDELYRRVNPEPDFDRLVAAVVRMWLDMSATGYPGDAIDRLAGALLVLRGDDDHLFSRRAAADLADRVNGAALANIPFVGHAAHVERPRVVAEIVTEFLKRPVPVER
jgi:pimeloyl-ACP methyl ester carboxylesterase